MQIGAIARTLRRGIERWRFVGDIRNHRRKLGLVAVWSIWKPSAHPGRNTTGRFDRASQQIEFAAAGLVPMAAATVRLEDPSSRPPAAAGLVPAGRRF